MTEGRYGEGFTDLGEYVGFDWQEFMHYLYLPVRLPRQESETGTMSTAVLLPARLAFLYDAIEHAMSDANQTTEHLQDPYVYVTARRGFATPGNPLNRPGWHCDDFGGTDLNYIWSDVYPTQFLLAEQGLTIPDDDKASMDVMAVLGIAAGLTTAPSLQLLDAPVNHLLRLTPWVIHNTPEVPPPGGMRSFFKISVSTHRYNLLGNSRNYLLDYDWPMVSRQELRNQPSGGNRDYTS